MADYRPSQPFNIPFNLLVPTLKTVKGVKTKVFTPEEDTFFCSFRSFGGTEKIINDVLVLEDTATIETWYDPRIKANCNIQIEGDNYEILGTPENINKRNQFLRFKVRLIQGGA